MRQGHLGAGCRGGTERHPRVGVAGVADRRISLFGFIPSQSRRWSGWAKPDGTRTMVGPDWGFGRMGGTFGLQKTHACDRLKGYGIIIGKTDCQIRREKP